MEPCVLKPPLWETLFAGLLFRTLIQATIIWTCSKEYGFWIMVI